MTVLENFQYYQATIEIEFTSHCADMTNFENQPFQDIFLSIHGVFTSPTGDGWLYLATEMTAKTEMVYQSCMTQGYNQEMTVDSNDFFTEFYVN